MAKKDDTTKTDTAKPDASKPKAEASAPQAVTFTSRFPNLRVFLGRRPGRTKAPQQSSIQFSGGCYVTTDPAIGEALRNATGYGRDFDEVRGDAIPQSAA